MKGVFVVLLLAVAASAISDSELFEQYQAWCAARGKDASDVVQSQRFENFKANYNLVEFYNRMARSETTFGLNDFADLSQKEFADRYLNPIKLPNVRAPLFEAGRVKDYPETLDWTKDGAVNAIKNQASCGSCWAFSTIANAEGVYFVKNKELPNLSEQQLVDCDHYCCEYKGQQSCDAGCNGGLMLNAMNYSVDNGLMTEKEYGYEGKEGTCKYDQSKATYKFTGFKSIEANEDAMVAALNELGPLSIGVDANMWSFYTGGIYGKIMPCGSTLNHGVALVGYGVEGSTKYWIVRNSWGTSWGIKGYMHLIRGHNKCGVDNYVNSIIA